MVFAQRQAGAAPPAIAGTFFLLRFRTATHQSPAKTVGTKACSRLRPICSTKGTSSAMPSPMPHNFPAYQCRATQVRQCRSISGLKTVCFFNQRALYRLATCRAKAFRYFQKLRLFFAELMRGAIRHIAADTGISCRMRPTCRCRAHARR